MKKSAFYNYAPPSVRESGYSLVETLVTITVLTIGALIFVQLAIFLGRSVHASTERTIAIGLASEGLEIVREKRDSNFFSAPTWSEGLIPTGGVSPFYYQVDYKQGITLISDSAAPYDPDTDPSYDIFVDGDGFYSHSGTQETQFRRYVKIEEIDTDTMLLTSVVEWGGIFGGSIKLEETLYNLYGS